MTKILVTGGAGFIGMHLIERLQEKGEVAVFDKSPGQAKFPDDIKFIEGDVTNRDQVDNAMQGIEYVFHMAVLPLNACSANPRACLDININGTFNIIEAAKNAGVKKIIYSSASSIYGDTEKTMDETHPFNARTMYGMSKLTGEYFLRAFYDLYKLDYIVLRYMNVYGPSQSGGLIMNTLKRIKEGFRPTIFGDGSQSFDFVYVDDVVSANILAMEKNVTNEAFNIGGEEEVTVRDIALKLLELTGSKLTPEFKTDEKVPMLRRVGSSQKAKRLLGYVPQVPLAEGLRRTIKSYFEEETIK